MPGITNFDLENQAIAKEQLKATKELVATNKALAESVNNLADCLKSNLNVEGDNVLEQIVYALVNLKEQMRWSR